MFYYQRTVLQLFILCLVILPPGLYAQPFSHFQTHGLPNVGKSSFVVADFDRNGEHDLFLTGKNGGGIETAIFLNQGDTTFLNIGAGITPVYESESVTADFNNDNWPDIAYTGVTASNSAIFRILVNNQDSTFQELTPGLPGIREGKLAAADFNNDGYTDICITGRNEQDEFIAEVYQNDGNMGFTKITSLDFEGVYYASLSVADFNMDGKQDIIYSGVNSSYNRVIHYYENAGDMNFKQKSTTLPALSNGSMIAFHADTDAYPDLFVSGKNYSGDYITEVYENLPGGTFFRLDTLEGVYRSSVTAADCNNDGYTDIAYQGRNNNDNKTILLYLNGSTDEVLVRDSIFGESDLGDIQWADLDNNGKVDLLLTGYSYAGARTDLWINKTNAADNPPNAPAIKDTYTYGDSAVISWNHATDDNTHKENLEYNLALRSEAQSKFVVSPMADTTSGHHFYSNPASFTDTFSVLRNLPESRYYWSVQSVDQTGKGSAFSVVDTFNTCHGFTLGGDIHTCFGSEITINPDDDQGAIEWFSAEDPNTPFSTDSVISFNAASEDTIWAKLTNMYGCIQYDTVHVHLYEYPTPDLGEDTSICYGDTLDLYAGNQQDTVSWYNFEGDVLAEDTTCFSRSWKNSDSIYVKVTTPQQCTNRDTIFVNVLPEAQWTLGKDTSLCKYDSLTLYAPENHQPLSWYLNDEFYEDSIESVSLSVENSMDVSLNVIDSNGCRSSDTIEVGDYSLPEANAGPDTLICPGTKAVLGPDGGDNNLDYSWTPAAPLDDPSAKNPVASPIGDTKFFLEVMNQHGCTDEDSSRISINPPSVITEGADTSICRGDTIKLGGNPTAKGSILPYNYKWEPTHSLSGSGEANPLVWPEQNTLYTLITYTAHCPIDTAFVNVSVNPLPDITIMNDSIVGYNEPFELWAGGGESYRWYPETGLFSTHGPRVSAKLKQEQTYHVEVTNQYGCSGTRAVQIDIQNEIFVPELFTPNGDGKNDAFKIYGFGIKSLQLKIFTMNGKLVYKTMDVDEAMNEGWDGTYRGKPLENGKYIWVLKGEKHNEEPVRFNGRNKGTVMLIR